MNSTLQKPKRQTKKSASPTLHTLALTFNLPLKHDDIPAFRGAMVELAGKRNDLFHNHDASDEQQLKNIHRYPLIQYQVHHGKAAIFAINKGAGAVEALLQSNKLKSFTINGHPCPLSVVERIENHGFRLDTAAKKDAVNYRIYKWLALNPDNYSKYKSLPSFVQKVKMLEHLLANHIVAVAKQLNWSIPKARPVKVTILDIDRITKVKLHDNPLMAFDLVYSGTALLPDRIAIGKGVSHGYGWQYRLG